MQLSVDVGEAATEARLDGGQARPALALAGSEPLPERGLGRIRDRGWRRGIFADPAQWRPVACRPVGRRPARGAEEGSGTVAGGRGGGRSPFQIMLRASERRWLKTLVRKPTAQQRQVTRARIVLLAAAGWTNAGIARKLEIAPNTAAKWRKRYVEQGVEGLADRKRPGRPRGFAAPVVAEVKAIACELPATRGAPLSRWSPAELRQAVIASGLVDDVSTTTLGRWLAEDAIRPWRHHAWIFPRDPAFGAKATRVLDLYEGVVDGQPLGQDEYVISADEKTSIQARRRCHPTLPPGRARSMRVEHEYERGGALAYLAAWDVHHARLFGRCEPSTGIDPFGRLVAQVHDHRAVRLGPPRVLGGRQRLLPPRADINRPPPRRLGQPAPGPPAGPRLLVEPDRATRGRMRAVVRTEGGSTEVEGVVPGPVRKDRPRLGVRRG